MRSPFALRPLPFALVALLLAGCAGPSAAQHTGPSTGASAETVPPHRRAVVPGVGTRGRLPAPDAARRAAVLEALRTGGRYVATTLLDERGFSRCDYDVIEGQWHPYEEAWHTGQAIQALVEAHRVLGNPALLAAARRAGDAWAGLAIEDHPVLAGYFNAAHGDALGSLINFTTIADGTPGLFNLSRLTGDTRYADVATRAGDWALRHLYLPDEGLLYDLVDATTGEILTDRTPHGAIRAAFPDGNLPLEAVARPNNEGYLFLDMYRHTGEARYRDVFLRLSDGLVERQDEHGLWMAFHPNEHARGSVHPRFNVWYAESLLEAFELTGDRRYLEAAARTGRAMQRLQRADGRIFYTSFVDGRAEEHSVTGSAVSFAGLLWLRLVGYGYDEFAPSVERSVAWVLANRFAEDHADPNLAGAFFETRARRDGTRVLLRVRGIATTFGLRFLAAYHLATTDA